jgi:hypothetical protein
MWDARKALGTMVKPSDSPAGLYKSTMDAAKGPFYCVETGNGAQRKHLFGRPSNRPADVLTRLDKGKTVSVELWHGGWPWGMGRIDHVTVTSWEGVRAAGRKLQQRAKELGWEIAFEPPDVLSELGELREQIRSHPDDAAGLLRSKALALAEAREEMEMAPRRERAAALLGELNELSSEVETLAPEQSERVPDWFGLARAYDPLLELELNPPLSAKAIAP